MGSVLGLNRDDNYIRCATLIVRVGGMPQTVATYYNAQMVGCLLCSVIRISMKVMSLRTCARCADLVPCCGQNGYRAQVLQNPTETPQQLQNNVALN